MTRVRILKVLLVVLPVVVIVVLLRGLGEGCRRPEGFVLVEETARWRIYGPAGDAALSEVRPALDRFVGRFHEDWGEAFDLAPTSSRMSVYVFRDRQAFADWAPGPLSDRTERIQGYWRPDGWVLAAIARSGPALETLRHEAVHMILDRAVRGGRHAWSTWFNEGLAQVFQEGRIEGGRLVPGRVPAGLGAYLRAVQQGGELLPTWRFVGQDQAAFHANAGLNYAHALGLTRWLIETRRAEFLEYFRLEQRPGPVRPSEFTNLFGKDLQESMLAWLESAADR